MDIVQRQTAGQLEREISQKVQALYKKYLGHQPSKVTCQMFDEKLAIILENSTTQPELLLTERGQVELAQQVRINLNQAMQSLVKELVERVLQVRVLDVLSDTALDTGRTGIILVLSDTPSVRNPEAIPKIRRP